MIGLLRGPSQLRLQHLPSFGYPTLTTFAAILSSCRSLGYLISPWHSILRAYETFFPRFIPFFRVSFTVDKRTKHQHYQQLRDFLFCFYIGWLVD